MNNRKTALQKRIQKIESIDLTSCTEKELAEYQNELMKRQTNEVVSLEDEKRINSLLFAIETCLEEVAEESYGNELLPSEEFYALYS